MKKLVLPLAAILLSFQAHAFMAPVPKQKVVPESQKCSKSVEDFIEQIRIQNNYDVIFVSQLSCEMRSNPIENDDEEDITTETGGVIGAVGITAALLETCHIDFGFTNIPPNNPNLPNPLLTGATYECPAVTAADCASVCNQLKNSLAK